MPRVYVLAGPNLNLLGSREPEIYGSDTLDDIHARLVAMGEEAGVEVVCRQSNHEGDLIDWIHEAGREADFLLINPGGYTHTSVALRDALTSVKVPAVEIHLSNTHAREAFRHKSLVAPVVSGRIEGLGAEGYALALRYALGRIAKDAPR